MTENEMILHPEKQIQPAETVEMTTPEQQKMQYENVLRRRFQESPRDKLLAKHRAWMASLQHEYPMPYIPYKIGVYIRFFNQTQYSDEVYLDKHKQLFIEDIALCPRWTLVDFYVDSGAKAPHMENAKEWCRLLDDCFAGKVDLIVTQKASNVSDDPQELAFVSRILATQKKPIGVYFISEDVYTLASYYRDDLTDRRTFPNDWERLPDDELDMGMIGETPAFLLTKAGADVLMLEDTEQAHSEEGGSHAGMDE